MKPRSSSFARRRRTAVVGAVAVSVLVVTLVQGVPASAVERPTPPAWSKAVKGSAASGVEVKAGTPPESAPIVAVDVPGGDFVVATDGAAGGASVAVESAAGGAVTVVDGAWRELGSTGVSVASAGDPVSVKDASKLLDSARKGKGKAGAKDRLGKLGARFVDAALARKLGATGPVLELRRTDGRAGSASVGVRIPAGQLDGLFGADFGSRARWVQVDSSRATGVKAVLGEGVPVASVVEAKSDDVIVAPVVSGRSVMVMAVAAPSGGAGTGDFTATSLKPSAAWDVSAQTGTFSWSYPFRVPPVAAGPVPEVSLSYDSQSVDGLTGSTNNQPSAVGEGWSLGGGGFIERSYVGCAVDDGPSGAVKTSGDLCWKNANATVSFAGHSGELIQVAGSNQYRLSNDDGTRFTEVKGGLCQANGTSDTACWQMVTTDGTQYFFGLNQLPGWGAGKPTTNSAWTVPVFGNDVGEPCHASTFAASSCVLGWRWNLDYVVDVQGNAEAFYYNAQTNLYAKNGTTATSYVRGGELEHIEYGLTSSTVYSANAASGRVFFSYDKNGRCSDAGGGSCTAQPAAGNAVKPANPAAYPDVPFDQLCTSGGCAAQISPTFWSTSKLSMVKTQVFAGGGYKDVDSWALTQSFPAPGDGTSAALWLNSVTHTGYSNGTSLTEPAVTFAGTTMQNRVWAIDGLAPLSKWRISSIKTELGATVSVNYSGQECVPADRAAVFANPQANTKRCYPQWWSPAVTPPQAPQQDLFHKYVVTSVIDNPNTGGAGSPAIEKYYVYGTPGWRYNDSPLSPADKRSWSIFAGFDSTEVRVGSASKPAEQSVTKYTFFRGLNGDRASTAGGTKSVTVGGVADERAFAGRVREQTTINGVGGAVLSTTTTTPWLSAPTANNGYHSSWYTADATTVTTEPVSTGGTRTSTVSTSFEASFGLPVTVQTVSSDGVARCVTTTYAPGNTSTWVIGLPSEVLTTAGTCDQAASAGADRVISDVRTSYDGGAVGAAPSKGLPSKAETVTAMSGTAKTWTTQASSVYDSMGRVTEVTDVLGRTTKTAFTPAGATGPTTKVVTTNPVGWTSSTELDPFWGVVVKATDENSKVTTATYDALGRRTAVWLPNRPQASYPASPSTGFAYTVSQTQASVVATSTVQAMGAVASYQLVDGLGRGVQVQTPAVGAAGSVLTDTAYDSQGRSVSTTAPYWATAAPSNKLFVPTSMNQVPSRTDTKYDAAGRTLASVLYTYGDETSRTSYAYPGADRTDVVPPTGGTPTSTFTNAVGLKTKLTQYQTPTITGAGLTTSYEYNPGGKMTAMLDPVGNRWAWQYDLQGNQVGADDPDSGRTTTTFDLAGNVTSTTDARGQVLSYTYDQLNRKTGKYAGTTSGSLLASWSFDTLAKGKPTSSTSYTGSAPGKPGLAYTSSVGGYDDSYNPTATTTSIPAGAPAFGGTSYTISSAYNEMGSLQQRTLPAIGGLPLERMRVLYNGLGMLDSIQGTTMYGSIYYTPTGQLSTMQRGFTGVLMDTTFGYDPGTRARNQVIDASVSAAGTITQADRFYTRNAVGDVTKIRTTGAAGAETQCFRYDGLRQLTDAFTPSSGDCAKDPTVAGLGGAAPYWVSYTIDPNTGNRTTATQHKAGGDATTSYVYPAAGQARPHAATSIGANTYSYDATGNTITRPGQSLSWDESGKLSTITTTDGVTQGRVYDADGNVLIQTDSKAGSKLFLAETELTLTPGASTPAATRTYTVGGVTVAERSTKTGVSGNTLTWLSGDLNNTQDLNVNQSTGQVTKRWADPYGNTRGTQTPWTSDHGYLNAPTSPTTGLTQLGARAYDPVIGKFISVDPILNPSDPAQNNGYSYAHNNPVTHADPSGLAVVQNDAIRMNTLHYTKAQDTAAAASSATTTTHGDPKFWNKTPQPVQDYKDNKRTFGQKLFGPMSDAGFGSQNWDQLILNWALGVANKSTYYGHDSTLVKTIQGFDETQNAREQLRQCLQISSGCEDIVKAGYNAQNAGKWANLLRDAGTVLTWPADQSAFNANGYKLALGSYDMSGKVVSVDVEARVAVVEFAGSNDTTLGSAIAMNGELGGFKDQVIWVRNALGDSGPMAGVRQTFGWREELRW